MAWHDRKQHRLTLQWSIEDWSFQFNLRMISDYIVSETNAPNEKEKAEAMVW